MAMKTLFLIDANSLIHRCFHALPPFTAPDGRPSGALYGLANILLRIFREEKPDYAAALFDRPEPTFRDEIYPQYKAQRPKAADELISQIIEARNLFEKFGINVLEKPGAEADDLIATLAEKFGGEPDLKIVILSSDLDTLQLVRGDKVVVKSLKKGISETFLYDEPAVKERYGLKPEQLTDYKVFVGDASDNIKGIPGIGPKTAVELLQKFGDLDGVYKNLDGAAARVKEKLESNRGQTENLKKLITLNKNVDLEIGGLEELVLNENQNALIKYLQGLGFESIVKRMEKPNSLFDL